MTLVHLRAYSTIYDVQYSTSTMSVYVYEYYKCSRPQYFIHNKNYEDMHI